MKLPVEECLPELGKVLEAGGNAVLVAEPGAGKTTRVPLYLLEQPWMEGQGMVMLEPRRLAARSAAAFMAKQLGEQVGETVGYRIRMDSKTGPRTRITVVTEGILTQMLQHDPALLGTGLLIFDEFHERNLQSDLGLALSKQSQSVLREDLRLLVMSATLKEEPVAKLLGGAEIVRSTGTVFPVETRYLSEKNTLPIERLAAQKVREAMQELSGNILVFLPGIREIRKTELLLREQIGNSAIVVPLYGGLTQEQQQEAIRARPDGKRSIVLATSIAESSLTVEGITVVIDSGLRRTELFSPRTGMGRLVTVRAARDSADQRRGRAGRLAPGVCFRLYTEEEERMLPAETPPQILEADLAPLALALAAWGAKSPSELDWLNEPPAGLYQSATALLHDLGALDEAGVITASGREMARLGLHPRLARMLLAARPLGLGRLASLLAAMLEDSRGLRARSADAAAALAELARAEGSGTPDDALWPILQAGKRLARLTGEAGTPQPSPSAAEESCGLLLSFAYPDRIGLRREDGRYLLSGGRGAVFASQQHPAGSEYIVAAEVDDEGAEGRILFAAALNKAVLDKELSGLLTRSNSVFWDPETASVRALSRLQLGAITIKETQEPHPPAEQVLNVLLNQIKADIGGMLPWNEKSRQLQARIRFLAALDGSWPDVSDEAISRMAEDWLAPYLTGKRKKSDLARLNLVQILESTLSWEQQVQLGKEAPVHFTVPSGSRIAVCYEGPQAPFISVRLQEMFGLTETPRLGFGRIPLTIHLLSPAGRPVQVTSDLRSFWEHTYFDVKKDLKGRYPKHYWPDRPLEAEATRRVRPPGAK